MRATPRAVPRRWRLAAPATCAVPGCGASSSHASDFVRFTLHDPAGDRAARVCTVCLAGDVAGARNGAAVLAVAALFSAASAAQVAA